jgi:hypothetical protein
MISPSTFYQSYQLHHHRAKAIVFKKLLDEGILNANDVIDPIWSFTKDDLERTLRIEMRTNLFHAIETFFTLYFCLQPDENGNVDDLNLFYNLSKRSFYYKNIRAIADGGDNLNILNQNVRVNCEEIRFGQYLFYYGLKQDKFPPGLVDCLDAIRYGILSLANEMSDTAEYNSYKHALRSLPAFLEFAFAKRDTLEIVQSFDAKYSMTYFQEFKDNSFSYETKVFDTERDFKMTLLASNLIYNIIMFRRASIVRDLAGIPVGYYSKESIDDCLKRNISTIEFKNSFRRVVGDE